MATAQVELQDQVAAGTRGLLAAAGAIAAAAPLVDAEHEGFLLRVVIVAGDESLAQGLPAEGGEHPAQAGFL
ncbi:hypothetical protein SDC9_200303 [bioreactor metagenome]|uniref:Uncharacterized protein n=1 Tax=bioreactor metagenome TaxID=1076179 RepID=A0A645IMW6_9ZZZZ